MKLGITRPIEIEVDAIKVIVPVNYGEEDIPNDFPFRSGDKWEAIIDIDTGKIRNWPADAGARELDMKVVDQGLYYLLSGSKVVGQIEQDYVPHCIPEEYGDYIRFSIAADGTVASWSAFCTPHHVEECFFCKDD